MNLSMAKEGIEYTVKSINTDDEELIWLMMYLLKYLVFII